MDLDFKMIRQVEYEILLTIDSITSAVGIRYFLDFGTLLGALRHKGFIPWDDDIDIAMAPESIKTLERDARKLLPKHLIVVRHAVFPPAIKIVDTRYLIMERSKLDPSGTHVTHPAIDIFPFGYYRKLARFLPTRTIGRIAQKRPTAPTRAALSVKQNLPQAFVFSAIAAIPPSFLKLYADVVQRNPGPNWESERPELLVGHGLEMGTGIRGLPYSSVFPLREIAFEGKDFFAPCDADLYLTTLYGDWRTPVEYPKHILKAWTA